MNDDEILRRLTEAAREAEEEERARLDPRWDELSAGTLPESEQRTLTAEAERSPTARAALEAFSPLGPEFHRRVAARLRAEGLAGQEEPRRKRPAVAGRPRRVWGPWLRWPALAAAAASALLILLWPAGAPAPLPDYTATLTGGVHPLRSAPEEPEESRTGPPTPAVFASGNTLELVLRPRQAVEGAIAVAAYRRVRNEWVEWSPPTAISEQGTVRLRGRLGEEVRLPSGESTLLIAVGRAPLPPPAELDGHLAADRQASAATWAAWKLSVMVQEEPPPP